MTVKSYEKQRVQENKSPYKWKEKEILSTQINSKWKVKKHMNDYQFVTDRKHHNFLISIGKLDAKDWGLVSFILCFNYYFGLFLLESFFSISSVTQRNDWKLRGWQPIPFNLKNFRCWFFNFFKFKLTGFIFYRRVMFWCFLCFFSFMNYA